MTVVELIEKLQMLNPNSKVWVVRSTEVPGHGGSIGYTYVGEPTILTDANHVALTTGDVERFGYAEESWSDIAEGKPPKVYFDNVPRNASGAKTDVPGLGYWMAEGK